MPNPRITLEGRIGGDPELRFTPSGAAVCNFSMVTEDRSKVGEEWQDKDPSWWNVSVWRGQAENVAESLRKGDLVLVHGRIKQRKYETASGETRSVYDVDADTVAPSLRWNTAEVKRTRRSDGGDRDRQAEADPWSTQPPADAQPAGEPPF
jgi:single-strand DNA-binding protein